MELITKQTRMKTTFAAFALMSFCGAVTLSASELSRQAPLDAQTALAQVEFWNPMAMNYRNRTAIEAALQAAALAMIR